MIVAGLVLGGYCLWWRAGRSSATRWWMRTEPVEQVQGVPPFEALVWLPIAAETLKFIGTRHVSSHRVLPLWIYPGWLRDERAADARWLRRNHLPGVPTG